MTSRPPPPPAIWKMNVNYAGKRIDVINYLLSKDR